MAGSPTRDVFLSHATADKPLYVKPLITELNKLGISYWLDEAEINWGDNITARINDGLMQSRYVLVFLSKEFIGRNWPESELGSAINLENTNGQTIALPLICGDPQKILPSYPLLQNKAYLSWDKGVEFIAERLSNLLTYTREIPATEPLIGQQSEYDSVVEVKEPVDTEQSIADPPVLLRTIINFQEPPDHRSVTQYQELKSRMFALITRWVEFEDVTDSRTDLEFPGGIYRLNLSASNSISGQITLNLSTGIIPLHQILSALGEHYQSIEFLTSRRLDFGDVVRRSRESPRNVERLTSERLSLNLYDDQGSLTLTNEEDNGLVKLIVNGGFVPGPPPPTYTDVLSYLWIYPPTDPLENALQGAGRLFN